MSAHLRCQSWDYKLHPTGPKARASCTALSPGYFCMKVETRRQSVALFDLSAGNILRVTQMFCDSAYICNVPESTVSINFSITNKLYVVEIH